VARRLEAWGLRLRALIAVAAASAACATAPSPPPPASGEASAPVTQLAPNTTVQLVSTVEPTPRAATPIKRGFAKASAELRERYVWLGEGAEVRTLDDTFDPPAGFTRVNVAAGSFGEFLRTLPLRAEGAPVLAYDRRLLLEGDDPRVAAVAELDVSPVDIQQCADSVIRLHAEWRWSNGATSTVGYHFLSGDHATWSRYKAGERPKVDGKRVTWSAGTPTKDDHATYRRYLDVVFNYASTISLANKSSEVVPKDALRPGDFFVLPGGPGHAILILDVAAAPDGRRVALLGQGFMPAQDFHVLSSDGSAWFSLDGDAVDTPFWPAPFPWSSLHRMKGDP
jgi:hypothetical protein